MHYMSLFVIRMFQMHSVVTVIKGYLYK